MILSFHTWSSFIRTLSLHFLCVFFLFFPFHCVLSRLLIYLLLLLHIVAPFPFSFFLTRRFFYPSNITNALAFRTPSSREKSSGRRNYMYAPGSPASASPVRKTWKQVRYTQPRRTPHWQTARHDSTSHHSHLHITVTPLARHGGNNHSIRI